MHQPEAVEVYDDILTNCFRQAAMDSLQTTVGQDTVMDSLLPLLDEQFDLAEHPMSSVVVDQHFELSAEIQAAEQCAMPKSTDVPAGRMADYLHSLFEIGDTNDDGVLSPDEFTKLLSRSGFNFPDNVIAALVKAADVNEDGVIEYNEFVPAMLGVISTMGGGISTAADRDSLLPLLDEHFDLAKHAMSSVVEQSNDVAAATKVNSIELSATISASIAAKKQTLQVTLPLHAPGL